MRPILVLCAVICAFFLATLESTAEARRGSCANGACAAPAKVFTADLKGAPRAPAGGITIDGKRYDGGQFIPAPKAVDAAPVGDACEGRQPVRRVGKAVGRKLLAPVRLLRGGCRGGRCG